MKPALFDGLILAAIGILFFEASSGLLFGTDNYEPTNAVTDDVKDFYDVTANPGDSGSTSVDDVKTGEELSSARDPVYFVQVDAQDVVEKGAHAVLRDLKSGGVNTAVLQVFSDDDIVGVYWDSKIAPVREDILGDFISASHDEGLSVFVWMTTLDMPWAYDEHPEMRMKAYVNGRITEDCGWYERISPTAPQHREYIVDIFREIALNYDIDGILLQDDLYWESNEVFDDFTKARYFEETGHELTYNVAGDPAFDTWKAGWLTGIARDVNDEIKSIDPDIRLAVNVYAECALGIEWCLSSFGQDYQALGENSDYMAIMAYHVLSGEDPSWVGDVALAAGHFDIDGNEPIIKVQVVDWDNDLNIDSEEVKDALRAAKNAGAKNLGFYISERTMNEMNLDFRELG